MTVLLVSPTLKRIGSRKGILMLLRMAVCFLAALVAGQGCVSRLADEMNPGPGRASTSERSSHLLTPEGSDDLSRVDDAALAARVARQRADAEARTAATFRYAVEYQGDDLSADGPYRKLLFDMKQSETELDRLERELQSRKGSQGRAGESSQPKQRGSTP